MANDLYTLIQNKQADIESLSAGLAEKQKAAPTVEARLREATMGNDAGLNSLRQGYSEGMLELFKYDQEKAKSYLSPESQAAGMVADPMVGESVKQGKFMATAKANQETWKQLDKRKTVLGDLVKSSMDKYNAELAGDQTLIDAADKQLARALQLMSEERLQKESVSKNTDSSDIDSIKSWADIVETNGRQALSQINDKVLRTNVVEYLANKNVPILDATTLTKKKAYDNAVGYIDRALAILSQAETNKKDVSGGLKGGGIVRSGYKAFGGLNEETVLLENLVAKIAAGDAFEEAGKALTGPELDIVGGKIPTVKLDEKVLKKYLEEAKTTALKKRADVLGAYANPKETGTTTVGKYKVEIK